MPPSPAPTLRSNYITYPEFDQLYNEVIIWKVWNGSAL